jgi:hypothetical protein
MRGKTLHGAAQWLTTKRRPGSGRTPVRSVREVAKAGVDAGMERQ